jgi:hypothetical protein
MREQEPAPTPENHRVRSPACPPQIVAELRRVPRPTQPLAPFHPIARGRAGPASACDGHAHQVRRASATELPKRGFGREGIDLSIQKIAAQLPARRGPDPLVLHDASERSAGTACAGPKASLLFSPCYEHAALLHPLIAVARLIRRTCSSSGSFRHRSPASPRLRAGGWNGFAQRCRGAAEQHGTQDPQAHDVGSAPCPTRARHRHSRA